MCDLRFKFEEDQTKTAVTIEDDRYSGHTHRHTDKHTNTQTDIQVILYLCSAIQWPMPCYGAL